MEDERSQARLDQILNAAQKRFRHYGLSKTTMNEIAGDIGVSKASLYYYFKDKESIFNAVVEKEQDHFVHEMQKIIQKGGKAEWMLIGYITLRLDLLKKMLTLGKWTFGSYMEVKPLMMSLYTEFKKKETVLIKTILEKGAANKEFSIENITHQADFFIATLHGIRQGVMSGKIGAETIDLAPKEYLRIKNHSRMFGELFIKSISAGK